MKDYIYTLLILPLFYLCLSCTKHVYVPVESTRTEYKDNYIRDSIHTRDSVWLVMKGDTVWMEKYRTIYRDRWVKDSMFLQDTVRIPYPVDKIIYRNKTAWYQDLLIYLGMGSIVIIMLYLVKRRFK